LVHRRQLGHRPARARGHRGVQRHPCVHRGPGFRRHHRRAAAQRRRISLGRDLTLTDNSTWANGTIHGGPAGLTTNGTLTLVNGARNLFGLLTNNGTIDYSGYGYLDLWDTADLENAGTFTFRGADSEVRNAGPTSTFTNTGTILESGAGYELLDIAVLDNTGVVDVQDGTLNLSAVAGSTTGGTFMVDAANARLNFSSGTHTLAGATFTGDGRAQVMGATLVISANVSAQNFGVISGTLELNAGVTFTVTGDYTQTPSGNLQSDVASPSSYGQLTVVGQATLGGTLRLDFLGAPQLGDYQVLTYGSRVDTFNYIDSIPRLDGTGMHLELSTDQTTLSVVPD
jgi:hypothetical protein